MIDLKINKTVPEDKYIPDFSNFNDREFEDEMNLIQWWIYKQRVASCELRVAFSRVGQINCELLLVFYELDK